MTQLQYDYKDNLGYCVCRNCGGLVLTDEDETYLGENDEGAMEFEVVYRCENCGRVKVETVFG